MVVTIYNSSLNVQSFKGMYGPQGIGDHTYFTTDFVRMGYAHISSVEVDKASIMEHLSNESIALLMIINI
jgi:hypothetical protein